MLIALWIVNALLALAVLATGSLKLFRSKEALRGVGMLWVDDFAAPVVKLIGVAEIVGAFGVILPLLTGIAPILTPIASVALAVVMAGAIGVHVRRGEGFVPSLVVGLLAVLSAVLGFLVVLG